MVAESLLFRVNSLFGMPALVFGCCGSKRPLLLHKSISSSRNSSVLTTPFSSTKRDFLSPNPFFVRPVSATASKTTIPLRPPGRTSTMEDGEDTEVVDMKRKIPLPEVFLTFLKQNGVDPAVYDAARDLPRHIRCLFCKLSLSAKDFVVEQGTLILCGMNE